MNTLTSSIETQPKAEKKKLLTKARLLLVGAVAVVASACLPDPEVPEGPDVPANEDVSDLTARAIGDSKTFSADGQIINQPEVQPNHVGLAMQEVVLKTDVQSMIGAKTIDLTAQPLPEGDDITDISVIALGANGQRVDPETGLPATSPEDAIEDLNYYVNGFEENEEVNGAGSKCYALLTMGTSSEAWGHDVTGPVYNAALEAFAAQNTDVIIYDWGAIEDANAATYLKADMVHHTPAGKVAYQEAFKEAADDCADLIESQEPEPDEAPASSKCENLATRD